MEKCRGLLSKYQGAIAMLVCGWLLPLSGWTQTSELKGTVKSTGVPVEYATIHVRGTSLGALTDSTGKFRIDEIPVGPYTLEVSALGYLTLSKSFQIKSNQVFHLEIELIKDQQAYNEVVVTGTLKEVIRSESPVPVEVYTSAFLKKNPTPNIFEALQNVNGVRPQLNCNVCNTGDIHINGLEGPYTMVLIDGMPIVSSLSTVYGLMGIPTSMIERIEVVKGPASSLYGSEAVGGLINIITKSTSNAAKLSVDVSSTTWLENNLDIAFKNNIGKHLNVLTGINGFHYQDRVDQNGDHFTDVPLQQRISVFQKWNLARKENRLFSLAGRYMYEDRWGGDVRWTTEYRGGDSIYGESISTKRWELIGQYQLPFKEKMLLSVSLNQHLQDSYYGTTHYQAQQRIGFAQITWDKSYKAHDWLSGVAMHYTYYDDNTSATSHIEKGVMHNDVSHNYLPGVFVQNEWKFAPKHRLLLGYRWDYHSHHGSIHTPRLAYKWSLNDETIFRLNSGTGFRVVNLFTEDHAAMTGARQVIVRNDLQPERSKNININLLKKHYWKRGFLGWDVSIFYTHFDNKIVPDYDSNPNQIIYDNLNGYAQSMGASCNVDYTSAKGLKLNIGLTLMEVRVKSDERVERQMLTERMTGTWGVSYTMERWSTTVDYTGNVYSPMRLPLLGELDPRKEFSPWWSIQNVQFTYKGWKRIELYAGIKNLLNWTPNKSNPFLIARSFDPFDKDVVFDGNGQVVATPSNPYALTFDPTYVYAPSQGMRGFFGVRFRLS
jgi:outer membrane receptor for ferrienterochelin and colicins